MSTHNNRNLELAARLERRMIAFHERSMSKRDSEFQEWASLFSGKLFAMLVVYADETGTHGLKKGGKEPAPGVYGFIATPQYWEGFRHTWLAALAKHNAPYFHFRELNKSERSKPGNPYYGWDDDMADDFIYDMALVASEKAVPFGGNGSIKRIQGENARSYGKTYKIVFQNFFIDFDSALKQHFPSHKGNVSFFFDDNQNEEWIKILNATIKAAQKRSSSIGTYAFVKRKDDRGIPCQAADLFAYVNRQNTETIYEANQYTPLRACFKNGQFILTQAVSPSGESCKSVSSPRYDPSALHNPGKAAATWSASQRSAQ
jgi:hypothetical protein